MTQYLFSNYARFDIAFDRAQGSYLYDSHGSAYLDFASGIAVTSLGHQHPAVTAAIIEQAQKLLHCSNLYRIPEQEALAEALCQHSFADQVLFCNSGLEANEAALKLARKYFHQKGESQRSRFVAFDGGFHGRSLAQIGASPSAKMVEGFGPLPDWFDIAPADDIPALEACITEETSAVILEPLQGDGGGVHLFANEYLQKVRSLCDKNGVLLILDEIQCGNGRTGKLWCYEHSGITPDIMTTAKGLGGGFPIGAVLARANVAAAMNAGSHGTTFGGNPLACRVALAVLSELVRPHFLETVQQRGQELESGLDELVAEFPQFLRENRGLGLMRGLLCQNDFSNLKLVEAALSQGLLLVPAGKNVARLLPPLTASAEEMTLAVDLLRKSLQECV